MRKSTLGVMRERGPNPYRMVQDRSFHSDHGKLAPAQIPLPLSPIAPHPGHPA